MESRFQRVKNEACEFQTADPAVCVHQKKGLRGVGHTWGLSFSFFKKSHIFPAPTCLIGCLVQSHFYILTMLVFLTGDGRPRGEGVAHSPARVLRRGFKLARRLAIGESKDPRAHHQPFQLNWVHGQQSAQFS